jgi:signal transduction histidine kinase
LETARKELAEQQLYLTLIVGALILAVVVVIFFFRMIILKRRNERMLIDLNHEIEAQSEELRQANEEILAINDNLEKLVAERTEVIRNQNERLRQFAFMNAHKIRGPVASILGIVNLIADGRNEKISQELVTHLHTSATKLDKIIHEVSQQLDADESEADVLNHRQGTTGT